MATYTEKKLVQGTLLTGSEVTLYTCTGPVTKTIVKEISVSNTTAVMYTFILYVIPSGGSSADRYALFKGVVVQPNETKVFGLTTVLETGDSIAALASTTSVLSIAISGVEKT